MKKYVIQNFASKFEKILMTCLFITYSSQCVVNECQCDNTTNLPCPSGGAIFIG